MLLFGPDLRFLSSSYRKQKWFLSGVCFKVKNCSSPSNCLLCSYASIFFLCFFSPFCVASLIVLVPACSLSGAIRGAVLAAVAWLSWVQGPRGFHRALFLLSGDTCVVTGKLHYGLSGDGLLWLWGFTGRGCVWVRHCRCSQRWTCRTLKTSKGIVCVCVQKRKEEKATTLSDDSITNPLCFFLLNLCMKPKVIFF